MTINANPTGVTSTTQSRPQLLSEYGERANITEYDRRSGRSSSSSGWERDERGTTLQLEVTDGNDGSRQAGWHYWIESRWKTLGATSRHSMATAPWPDATYVRDTLRRRLRTLKNSPPPTYGTAKMLAHSATTWGGYKELQASKYSESILP